MKWLDGFRGAGAALSRLTERWVPDSWVICMLLTVIAFGLALGGAGGMIGGFVLMRMMLPHTPLLRGVPPREEKPREEMIRYQAGLYQIIDDPKLARRKNTQTCKPLPSR